MSSAKEADVSKLDNPVWSKTNHQARYGKLGDVGILVHDVSFMLLQGIQKANLRQKLPQKVGKMTSEEPKDVNIYFVKG